MKRFARGLAWVFLVLLMSVTLLAVLAVESSPAVVASGRHQVDQAESVGALLQQLKEGIRHRYSEQNLILTETQLNSLSGVAQRALPAFNGKVQISAFISVFSISYQLPEWLTGHYLNLHITLLPGDQLTLGELQIGHLTMPGWMASNLIIGFADWWTNSDIASQTVAQVKRVSMNDNEIQLAVLPMDGLLKQLNKVKNGIAAVPDEALRESTAHYLRYLDQLPVNSRVPNQSLALYLTPLMQEASRRSQQNPAWKENEAALMALAIYAGHHRFANFIGDVQPNPDRAVMPHYRPVLANRSDLTQHFIYSAAIKILSRKGISAAIGEFKELMDRQNGGSGYSFVDLAADMAGIKLAETALQPDSAMGIQTRLALDSSESAFFPDISGLPEGISTQAFRQTYGEVDSPAYLQMVNNIQHRLEGLPLYRQSQTMSAAISASR